jgi:nucleoside-triphosphatase THEP1
MGALESNTQSQNQEFETALEYVLNTNHCVFLTGKAGTGKTTFLKKVKSTSKKNVAVIAPTGIAALNAGGQTIHSFFKLPFGPTLPGDRRFLSSSVIRKFRLANPEQNIYSFLRYNSNQIKLLERLDTLIIDEVSMMRADTLDIIDQILKIYLGKPHLPFGGKQLVLIGDPFQLPPVVKDNDAQILKNMYPSFEFFQSDIFKSLLDKGQLVGFELKKVYRQTDQVFIDILNRIRTGDTLSEDINLLNSRMVKEHPEKEERVVEITSHNYLAANTNAKHLAVLPNEPRIYKADIEGKLNLKQLPCEQELILKIGAQVVFVKNDSQGSRYVNGSVGLVQYLDKDSITVDLEGEEIDVPRETWHNTRYTWNGKLKKAEAENLGSFKQYPLRLAWSITVHKSQGLTLEKVFADLSQSFAPGQVYVALSRCASLKGLYLKSAISNTTIRTSNKARSFLNSLTELSTAKNNMKRAKAEDLYRKAFYALRSGYLTKCHEFYKEALQTGEGLDLGDKVKRCEKIYAHKLDKQRAEKTNNITKP